jgi:hypothetical protein
MATLDIDAGRPWICRARRAALRAALGRHVLMVWRVDLEDSCGRVVESMPVPLIVDVGCLPGRWTTRAVDDLRRRIELDVFGTNVRVRPCESGLAPSPEIANGTVRGIVARWCEAAEDSAHALVTTRLVRERAIQAQTALGSTWAIQAGLFDRRAERAYLSVLAGRAEDEAERRNRIARLERAAAISLQPPQLLLVLLP